jgi:copper(I)-binding protein
MHRSAMKGGVMSMAPQTRVVVPAHGSVAFAPGGYHLMFIGLRRALKPGDRLSATLLLEGGRRIGAEFAVGTGGPPRRRGK